MKTGDRVELKSALADQPLAPVQTRGTVVRMHTEVALLVHFDDEDSPRWIRGSAVTPLGIVEKIGELDSR